MSTISREFRADWAFDSTYANSVPQWTNITEYVKSFSTTHGRSKELDRMESSSMTLELDNQDGRFTPGRTGSPYYPNVKARKPIRAYTIVDDNYLHFETANPPLGDLVNPRFETFQGDLDDVTAEYDGGAGRIVFRAIGEATFIGQWRTYIGLQSDAIHVTAGTSVSLTGSILTALTTLCFEVYDYTDTLVTTVFGSSSSASSTVASDGYVRPFIRYSGGGFAAVDVKFHSLKVRLNGVGSSTVAGASGHYPEFWGYVETIKMTYDGKLSYTNVTANDASASVLNRDIPSKIRSEVADYLSNEHIESAYYWPMSQADDDRTKLVAELGGVDLPVGTNPSDDPWSFSGENLPPHVDGPSGGCMSVLRDSSTTYADYVFKDSGLGISMPKGTLAVNFWLEARNIADVDYDVELLKVAGTGPSGAWSVSCTTYLVGGVPNFTATLTTAAGTQGATVTYTLGTSVNAGFSLVYGGGQLAVYTYVDASYSPSSAITMSAPTSLDDISVQYIPTAGNTAEYLMSHLAIAVAATTETSEIGGNLHTALLNAGSEDTDDEVGRLERILAAAEWPGVTSLDDPLSDLLSGRWENGANGWEEIQLAAGDAGGLSFIGPSGDVVYQNRHRRSATSQKWRYPEWSDGVVFDLDEARIYNYVKAERTTGLFRVAEDTDSQDEHGQRPLTVRRNVLDPNEVADAAADLLNRYRGDRPQCDTLRIDGTSLNGSDGTSRTNMVLNPSFEYSTTGWTAVSGCTIARSDVGYGYRGDRGLKLTCSGSAEVATTPVTEMAATVGTQYTASAYFWPAVTGRSCTVRISWYNSSGSLLSSSSGTPVTSVLGTWTRGSVTATAPASTAYATVVLLVSASAGEVHYADAVLLEAAASAGAYFDGYSPGYAFTGAAEASTSTTLNDSELVSFCHGVRLSDRVDIVGLPSDIVPDEGTQFYVEGYTFNATPVGSAWVFDRTLQLSNAAIGGAWILESTENNGVLDDPACALSY